MRRQRVLTVLVVLVVAAVIGVAGLGYAVAPIVPGAAGTSSVTILAGEAESLDPALAGDAGSAQVIAQLYETVTAIDNEQRVQPALAAGWQVSDGGKKVTFRLRPNLAFSDGSPLTAQDVVRSWLRVLNPRARAPLASLLDGVVGAAAYRSGSGPQSGVGIRASGDSQVEVDLVSPAADFAAIAASPTFGIVPRNADSSGSAFTPGPSFVASGGYVATAVTKSELTLQANAHYWAGRPNIATIHLLTDIGGKSPVDEFQAGNLDYTGISDTDATWIAYDQQLGSSLRSVPSAAVDYFGFDTAKAPFSNVHVRRAFRLGVDWRTLVALGRGDSASPATSMVPPDLPGRSDTDFGPVFDVTRAKAELAAAGYENGKGFPAVTLVTTGGYYEEAVVRQLHDNLGIDIAYETVDFTSYLARLADDPPAIWAMGWVADYPGADDFLGLLLGTGKPNNYGRWSSTAFDAAISEALSAASPSAMTAGFDKAQAIVRDDVPVIPVDYGTSYALARKGLLGAAPNGQGLLRYAGLAWAGR